AWSLFTPNQSLKNGPWAWNTSLPRDEEPHSLCWAYHLCKNIFPCYKPNICSFFLRKHLANPTVISVLCGEHT
ncbi:hypothetical protein DBR06_SOUSAS2910028, partial [Sousa chinensis]